jgi:uncharacterized delta-60 repeat protein
VLGSFTYPAGTTTGFLAAAVDSQDRLLLIDAPSYGQRRLSRLNAGISGFDTSFNGTGQAQVTCGGRCFLEADAQDRALVRSEQSPGTVTRFTAAGGVDATYGSAGTASIPQTSPTDQVLDMSVMGSGMVAVLRSSSGAAYLSRVTAAGAPDAAFGGTGRVDLPAMDIPDLTAFGPVQDWNSKVAGAAALTDVVVAGSVIVSDPKLQKVGAAGFQKVAANGGIDGTFGGSGLLIRRTNPIDWLPLGVSPGGSGSLLVELQDHYNDGYGYGSDASSVILRLTSNGALDTSYANGGAMVVPDGFWTSVDPAGRVLMFRTTGGAGGFSFPSSSPANRELRRYNASGVLDTAFAGDGSLNWAEVPAGQSNGCVSQMTVLSDSTVVLAYHDLSPACSTTGFDKVSAAGVLSPNWAPGLTSALAPLSSGTYLPAALSLWTANSGGMYASYRGSSSSRLLRLTGAGAVDATFGGTTGVDAQLVTPIDVLADNSVVGFAPGPVSVPGTRAGVVRFLPNGTRVTSTGGFGADGVLPASPNASVIAQGSSILVQEIGWISTQLSAFDSAAVPLSDWPSNGAGGGTVVPPTWVTGSVIAGRMYLVDFDELASRTTVIRLKGTLP